MEGREEQRVRCADCRCEYELAPGSEPACPDCGSLVWISARIPVAPVEPARR